MIEDDVIEEVFRNLSLQTKGSTIQKTNGEKNIFLGNYFI
jgi:hypothetical protein